MRINKDTRYAVVALSVLYKHQNEHKTNLTLKDIAQETKIKPHSLVQIFYKLKHAGVVKSIRGPGGGYLIEENYQNITLLQLMQVLEGNFVFHNCKGKQDCEQGEECTMHGFWSNISNSVFDSLEIPIFTTKTNKIASSNH